MYFSDCLTKNAPCDRVTPMKRCLFACAISLLFAACQSTSAPEEEKKPQKEKKEAVYYIGSIYKVYPDSKFALVRVVKQKPAVGTTLISHPIAGPHVRMANLQVSPERINNSITPLIAADVRSGQVEPGDAVYIYRALGQDAPTFEAEGGATPAGTATTSQAATADPAAGVVSLPATEAEQQRRILAQETQIAHEEAELLPAIPAAQPKTPTPASTPATAPTVPSTPQRVPDRIKNIPRNFSDWDNM